MLICKELISSSLQKITPHDHAAHNILMWPCSCWCWCVVTCPRQGNNAMRVFCFVVFVFKRVSNTVTAVSGRKSVKNKWIPRVTAYAMKFGARNWTWLMLACVCHAAGLHAMVSQLCWFSVEKKFTAPANEAWNRWDLSPACQTLKLNSITERKDNACTKDWSLN